MLTHLSLCSGIGGIDLAGDWAGFKTVAQCEIDKYASNVLAKNFKGVPNLHDIRTVTNSRLREHGIDPAAVTLVSAGFPCQPYSLAGKGLGVSDERDLWSEVARVLGEIMPRWFVGENTRGLFARENQRYFRRILSDLNAMGYTVAWGIWGACDVGASHERKRVFIIAHSGGKRRFGMEKNQQARCPNLFSEVSFERVWKMSAHQEIDLLFSMARALPSPRGLLLRNDNGFSPGVDRLRCLGNAVVPQQVYPLLKVIADYENGVFYEK